MKFVVRENITGKMGTFETRFTVPDLSADTSGLKLSTVIWSNQREPVDGRGGLGGAVHAEGDARESADRRRPEGDPQHHARVPAEPEPVRELRRLRRAARSGRHAGTRRVKVSMSLFNKKGVKTFEVGPIDATQLAPTRPEAVPVQVQIPLKDVTRGEYICQINVVDEVGRKFAFPRAPIIVQ